MLKFEYEDIATKKERDMLDIYFEQSKLDPDLNIHQLMKNLDVYTTHKDMGKHRIGSGSNHVFVCRLNKKNDRILIITNS